MEVTELVDEWTEIMSSLPGFELDTIKTMIGGRSELLLGMLHSFLNDFAGESSVIVSSIQKNQIATAEKQLHRLKGAAGSLGAKELHQACEILDAQLKLGSYSADSLNDWLKIHDKTMVTLANMLTKWEGKT